MEQEIPVGLTFDDVLLVPARSEMHPNVVDVTTHLSTGPGNRIVVRVWNTGWCGGIWKNVKLVATR